jgi:uncharacterized protein (DUF952 family)
MLVYHIVHPAVWAAFDIDLYCAASLESEGFIHCSFANQLDAVINRYYKDEQRLIVLEIETEKLMSRVINEPSTKNEIYPHVYGPINRDAIVGIRDRKV